MWHPVLVFGPPAAKSWRRACLYHPSINVEHEAGQAGSIVFKSRGKTRPGIEHSLPTVVEKSNLASSTHTFEPSHH